MPCIILFDGECHFCDASVQFIMQRDGGHFSFASLQSDIGQQLLRDYNVPTTIDSLVLIEQQQCYVQSTAALRICRHLTLPWRLFTLFLLVPAPLRNIVYTVIAKNRYKWFGKKAQCMLPTAEERQRFL